MKMFLKLLFLVIMGNYLFALDDPPEFRYHIGWESPNLRFYDITMTIENPSGKHTDVRIPDWRPGRYRIQDFARLVVDFRAENKNGQQLTVEKIDKITWRISHTRPQRVVVRYRFYANEFDAGNSYLDDNIAYINPSNLLMYVPGQELRPVAFSVQQPDGWQVTTALDYDARLQGYPADNYHELIDNPFVISPNLDIQSFMHDGAKYEIVFYGRGNYDAARVLSDIRKIVAEQLAIFGEAPFRRYVFFCLLVDFRMSHGVEHKNSTVLVSGPADFSNGRFYENFLGLVAHEFFHVWNVERIRPAAIYHPDYSRPNYTRLMWWFEGVTSYYDALTLCRTGLISEHRYYSYLSGKLNSLENNPGSRITSAADASFNDWTTSSGAPPGTNISFYSKGEVLGLLLDLKIRQDTNDTKSLDDVFRYLNENYAQKDRGVPEDGIRKALEEVSGVSFGDFFEKYVDGTAMPDYNRFLQHVGLEMVEMPPDTGSAILGIRLGGDSKETVIRRVFRDSPAAIAGLAEDDILLAIDGDRTHVENFERRMKRLQPGDTVTVTVFRRDQLRTFDVLLQAPTDKRYFIRPLANADDAANTARKKWLKSNQTNPLEPSIAPEKIEQTY